MKVHIVKEWKSPRSLYYECYQNPSRFVRWYFWKRLDVALNMCNINRDDIVLDVGCWMGYFLPTLAQCSNNVIGLDTWEGVCDAGSWDERVVGWSEMNIARELIDTELEQHNITLIKSDGCALPLKNSSIDILFCLDAMEHIPDTDKLLSEFYEVLKDDGIFIASLPNEWGGALVLRQVFSKLVGSISREKYSIWDLIRTVFTRQVPEELEKGRGHHRGYDYRNDVKIIEKYFRVQMIGFCPIGFLFGLNPTVIIKAVKR